MKYYRDNSSKFEEVYGLILNRYQNDDLENELFFDWTMKKIFT